MAANLLPYTTNFTAKLNVLKSLDFSTFEAETLLLETDILKQNRGNESRMLIRQESRNIMNNLKGYIRELKEIIRKPKPNTKMETLSTMETWIISLKVPIIPISLSTHQLISNTSRNWKEQRHHQHQMNTEDGHTTWPQTYTSS